MLRCYRQADLSDPEVFTKAAIAILVRYPESIVRLVTDPARGLPSKLKWMPTLAEISEACEKEMAPIRREMDRQRAQEQARLQIAARANVEVAQEARDRAVERWQTMSADMRSKEEQRQKQRVRSLDELEAAKDQPIEISDELRKSLISKGLACE